MYVLSMDHGHETNEMRVCVSAIIKRGNTEQNALWFLTRLSSTMCLCAFESLDSETFTTTVLSVKSFVWLMYQPD